MYLVKTLDKYQIKSKFILFSLTKEKKLIFYKKLLWIDKSDSHNSREYLTPEIKS